MNALVPSYSWKNADHAAYFPLEKLLGLSAVCNLTDLLLQSGSARRTPAEPVI